MRWCGWLSKRADYVLYFKPNIPLALIEAKDKSHGASVATRNTGDYEGCGIAVIDPWEQAKAAR